MRILVTGGLGFLGQHLARCLLRAYPACALTLVDDLSSSRLDHAWLAGRAEIRVEDFSALVWKGRDLDRIYHLASPVGSLGILAGSGRVAKMITDLAVRAGELAAETGASLLYVSSSETYGRSGARSEEDEVTIPAGSGPRMEYLLGKLAGEHLLRNLAQRNRFRLTLVRPFNTIGEHQSSRIGFVVPTFFENALAGRPLPLFFGGGQTRCFCHAEDMAEGLLAVQEKGTAGEIYNLGNPENGTSIRALAEAIRSLCGSSSPLEAIDPRERFGSQYLEASAKMPRIDKVRAHTGWSPTIGLKAALDRIHAHYLRHAYRD